MEDLVAPYQLSALLEGHRDDVRALISTSSTTSPRLFSASRDSTARSWCRTDSPGQGKWYNSEEYVGHEGFVNSITWVGGDDQEFLLTGGIDGTIQVYDLAVASTSAPRQPSRTLYGHTGNVCSLHALEGRVVSGSWDGTARVWDVSTWEEKFVVVEKAAVWDVLALKGQKYKDSLLTASADSLIRLWKEDKITTVFKGHTGAVRALAKISPEDPECHLFASASNDGSIRIWTLSGDAITVLDGHDSFIYALVNIAGGGLVSSGEDGVVRIWSEEEGELEQEILVPALSVWTLACMPNGDIAIGCSDNLIWIFTRESSRIADVALMEDYDDRIAQRIKPVTKQKPVIEAKGSLAEPGSVEGAIKLVAHDDQTTHAYTWSGREWQDVGEVISEPEESPGTPTSHTKTLFEGRSYDFVFQIDVSDDQPALPLPYNLDEDMDEVAQEFVVRNKLPLSYVERIVEFIRMNLG